MNDADFADDGGGTFRSADDDLREVAAFRNFLAGLVTTTEASGGGIFG